VGPYSFVSVYGAARCGVRMVRYMSKPRTSPVDVGIEQQRCRHSTRHYGLWNELDIIDGCYILIAMGFAGSVGLLACRQFVRLVHSSVKYLGQRCSLMNESLDGIVP
jgi:hypothetical protein